MLSIISNSIPFPRILIVKSCGDKPYCSYHLNRFIFLNCHDLQVVDEMEVTYGRGFSPMIQSRNGLRLKKEINSFCPSQATGKE